MTDSEPVAAPPAPTAPFYRQRWFLVWAASLAAIVAFRVVKARETPKPTPPAEAAPSDTFVPRSQPVTPSSAAAVGATQQPTGTAAQSAPSAQSSQSSPAAERDDFLFTMPDFAGVKLQAAQNAVQGLGVFLSRSHDLRGSRRQVLDRNWQVCNQTPAAGTKLYGSKRSLEGKIDFGVVKTDETCP